MTLSQIREWLKSSVVFCKHCPGCEGYAHKWEDIDHDSGCQVVAFLKGETP